MRFYGMTENKMQPKKHFLNQKGAKKRRRIGKRIEENAAANKRTNASE